MAWNANVLAFRHAELIEFTAQYKPDVLFVGKTNLNPSKQIQ